MNDAIGGYFELELRRGKHYHKDTLRLNTARNCFEYVLLARKYKKVYIPYYTCEVMLQPLLKHRITFEYYHVGMDLEPTENKDLQPDEAFLYTNYFGLKQSCVERLAKMYGTQFIVDNAQAFFAPRIEGIDTFYSPRKFFGVPDGGYLYTDCLLEQEFPRDKSFDRMRHLLRRIDEGAEAGYADFRQDDDSLDANPIRRMSKLTERLLESVDYEAVCKRRRANFLYLHNHLGNSNLLSDVELHDGDVPMVYPYYNPQYGYLKELLLQNKVFIATYWANVLEWCEKQHWEWALAQQLCSIPVDQRYESTDMEAIIENYKKILI